jgi:2-keto-3-deoxy-L-rhamnonate aldolase RhmA
MLVAPPNPMLEKLARREAALGVLVFSSDPAVTEMAGGAGFDLVLIDTEHAALGLPDIVAHVRAAQCAGVSCWVRVGRYDTAEIGRVLDAGAQGIVFPHYGLHPEATATLAAMRYAPTGERPTCTGIRGTAYGITEFAAYATRANRDMLAVGLVEDREVVDHIDEVLEQSPIQAVMPGGAGDLASSLGVHGQARHPLVLGAIRRVVTAAKARPQLAVGVYISDVDSMADMLALAADFYVFSIDYKILARAFKDIHTAWLDGIRRAALTPTPARP